MLLYLLFLSRVPPSIWVINSHFLDPVQSLSQCTRRISIMLHFIVVTTQGYVMILTKGSMSMVKVTVNAWPTRHVFVKHGCPRRQQSQIWQKSLSPIFWPAPSPGACHARKMWGTNKWTYSPSLVTISSSKLCILHFVCNRDGITDRQTDKRTDRRTDDPITRCSRRTFQDGGIKIKVCLWNTMPPAATKSKKLFLAWRSKSRSQGHWPWCHLKGRH